MSASPRILLDKSVRLQRVRTSIEIRGVETHELMDSSRESERVK